MYQYYAATGNKTFLEEEAFPVIRAVAEFWASFVQLNETTGLYETFNMSASHAGDARSFA